MYNTMGYFLKQKKHNRITEVPTLCPILGILSYSEVRKGMHYVWGLKSLPSKAHSFKHTKVRPKSDGL